MRITVIFRVTASIIFVEKKPRRVIFTLMPPRNHDRSPDKKNFSIALPKGLITDLQMIADQETRSRNGQIEHFLRDAVTDWKKENSLSVLKVAGGLGNESSRSTPAKPAPTEHPKGIGRQKKGA